MCLILGNSYLTVQINVLDGYIRVCSTCKKIEDEGGGWVAGELYMSRHSEAECAQAYARNTG